MEKDVHISQFYPCSEVSLACELYYICELGKYLHYNHEQAVSLDGVVLDSCLRNSDVWDFFRLAVDKGWVINTGIPAQDIDVTIQYPLIADEKKISNVLFTTDEVPFDQEDFNARKNDLLFAYSTPEKLQVSFEKQDDVYWLWSIKGKNGNYYSVNNKAFGNNLAHQRWLSLVAMVSVHRLKYSEPESLVLNFGQDTVLNNVSALSYLQLLDEDKRCFYGWCFLLVDETVSDKEKLQMGYASWYKKGEDLGLLSRWYSPDEKLKHLKEKNISEGDIVALYQRAKSTRMNYMKQVASCHMAKILKINKTSITFEIFNTVKTKHHGYKDFMDKTTAVRKMYSGQELYNEFNTTVTTIDLTDCGVEYYMYSELYFIVDLDGCDDKVEMLVTDGYREDHLIVPQNDSLYWLLKDFDVEFNEDKFLKKFFKTRQPLYTQYMNGDTLADEFYYKEEADKH